MLSYDKNGGYSQHHLRSRVVLVIESRSQKNEPGYPLTMYESKAGGHKSPEACADESEIVFICAYFFQLLQAISQFSAKIRPDYMREICFKKVSFGTLT